MEEILSAYGIPKEIVDTIMMLYKNTRSMVRSHDGDTNFIDVTTGVLQGDAFAPFLFIVYLDYVLKKTSLNEEAGGIQLRQFRRCNISSS